MKRGPGRVWPKNIVEVPARRHDPRAADPPRLDPRAVDPQATQKITRAQLDEALKRTTSGTRLAVRSEPKLEADDESFAGPRDDDSPNDSPQITIVRIDSIELETIDPSSLRRTTGQPMVLTPMKVTPPSPQSPQVDLAEASPRVSSARMRRFLPTERLSISPRTAFIAGLAVAVFVLVAAFIGFFAGRGLILPR